MKYLFFYTGIAVTIFSLLFLACGQKKEQAATNQVTVNKEAAGTAKTAGEYAQQEKEEYQDKIETRLKEYDAYIDELKARAAREGRKLKADYEKEIAALEKKRNEARKKLDELKVSSEKAWKELAKGLDSAADDLGKAVERARAKFK